LTGGQGNAGERPERQTSDETAGQSGNRSALFIALPVVRKAINAKRTSQSVRARDGRAIEFFAILSPGVVISGTVGCLDFVVKGFGIDELRLAEGFAEGGEIKGFVLVKDGNVTMLILANDDGCFSEGIRGAVGLDLIDDIVVLHGQVLGDGAGFLARKN
jgi:hypothetical protein